MKRIVLALIALSLGMATMAQTDSTSKENADTIKVGGVIIIRKGGHHDSSSRKTISILNNKDNKDRKKNQKVSTNWFIVDLGFANYNENTNYSSAAAQSFAPGFTEEDLKLRTGKSVNVNFWFFMQRMSLIKKAVNLKYGLGLELNNYRFDNEQVRFEENPTRILLDPAYKGIEKNKLAADYVTVPLMLNFNLTPGRKNGFGLSAGVSGGYLYSSRQKTKDNDDKDKLHDDFDLRKWKLAYIGELTLGPVRLYGSYAMKSMWEKGLDQTPYAVGLRLSHF
jgi:hypothetical protein